MFPVNVVPVGETIPPIEMVSFGEVQITIADSKLLDEFKADYDEIIKECVKTDFTVSGVNIDLSDQYMRATDTPRGYVLIARNESWEEGVSYVKCFGPKRISCATS